MQDLFSQFESLGANCEFGFVQRRAGLEPPGLLRWAMATSPAALTAAIKGDFAGIFAFENLVPFNEGMVLDRALGLAFHSALRSVAAPNGFVFADPEEDRRDLYRFEQARIAGLLEGIRTTMREGSRIFVFCKYHGVMTPHEIAYLFAALRERGPARLLIVSLATPDKPAGSMIAHVPGLLHGRIDRFAPGDHADDVSFALWQTLCRRALEMAPA